MELNPHAGHSDEPDIEEIRNRVAASLSLLRLSAAQRERLVTRISNRFFKAGSRLSDGTFDFHARLEAVLNRIAEDGLDETRFITIAHHWPRVLMQSAERTTELVGADRARAELQSG